MSPSEDEALISEARNLLGGTTGRAALDIGAGIGKTMVSLAQAGFDAFGIEPSVPFRTRAVERMGIDPSRLAQASIESASFPPQSFDFINFGAVLEHVYSPSASIARVLPWLRPRGVIHIDVPTSGYLMARLLNLFYRLRGTSFVTHLSPMHPPFHLFEFSLKSFVENGRRAGYEIAAHRHYPGAVPYLPRFMDRPMKSLMTKTGTCGQLVVWLCNSTER